jgi:glycosyltransferase involved in cell wall biosynthesis
MIASAHIGLSFYRPASDNEKLTGAASSKTAQYLQCGLPVIVNDFESIRKVVQQYGYGICADSPSRIPEALDHIIMHYDEMRQNAFRCYREKYEITPYLRRIVDMFEGLEAARSYECRS